MSKIIQETVLKVIEGLLKALEDDDEKVRLEAALALGRYHKFFELWLEKGRQCPALNFSSYFQYSL
jgi:hypothetical protein